MLSTIAGTVLTGGRTFSIVSTIGTDLIIKTLTTTTSSICTVLTHLTYNDQPSVQDMIDQLKQIDLEHTITVIEELVREQEGKETHTSVKKALLGVHEILEKIHDELKSVQKAVEYHDSKYFRNWRSFNCSYSIETIKKHKLLLDNRYKILIDLLKIYN